MVEHGIPELSEWDFFSKLESVSWLIFPDGSDLIWGDRLTDGRVQATFSSQQFSMRLS